MTETIRIKNLGPIKDVEIKGRHPASHWRLKNKDQVNITLYVHVLIYAAGKDADYSKTL